METYSWALQYKAPFELRVWSVVVDEESAVGVIIAD